MLVNIFKAILITSLTGTPLALVLTMIKPVTRRFFSSSWHYYIWLAVLIVMLVPVSIRFPEKMHPVPESVSIETEVQTGISEPINPDAQKPILATDFEDNPEPLRAVPADKIKLLAMLWLTVAVAMFLSRLARYAVFLKKLKRSSYAVSCPELAEFTTRKIKVRISEKVYSPFMTGIFSPVLVLPKAEFATEQLRNILTHEMTHFKRKDIWYKWFAFAVKCIHWFNPAVYFICGQINEECEISCDAAVVRNMTKEQEMGYINTILSLIPTGSFKSVPLTTGMAGSKRALKKRFLMIKNKKKISRKSIIVSIVLAAAVFAVTALAGGLANGRLTENNAVGTDIRGNRGFNALVMGVDEQGRADSIMVVSVDSEGVNGISLPRNVEYDGKRISNLLIEENGCEKMVEAVRGILSIPINYYVRVETGAISDIVDVAGGVEFDVPMNMKYDDPYKNLHIDLKSGRQKLDGTKAVQLLQFRHSNMNEYGLFTGYENGDLSRIETGQRFMKALAEQLIDSGSLGNAAEIYNAVSGKTATNYSMNDLISDIAMFNTITADKIRLSTLPGTEEVQENGVFYKLDFAETETLLDVFRNKS